MVANLSDVPRRRLMPGLRCFCCTRQYTSASTRACDVMCCHHKHNNNHPTTPPECEALRNQATMIIPRGRRMPMIPPSTVTCYDLGSRDGTCTSNAKRVCRNTCWRSSHKQAVPCDGCARIVTFSPDCAILCLGPCFVVHTTVHCSPV